MIRAAGCSKSRVAKAAGAEVAVQQRNEKWHAAVARSTFSSQNAKKLRGSEPFCKCRYGKMARRCGAKHIFKSKCTKHLSFGAILQVQIWKNCTRLWREAHFQVKMYKIPQLRSNF